MFVPHSTAAVFTTCCLEPEELVVRKHLSDLASASDLPILTRSDPRPWAFTPHPAVTTLPDGHISLAGRGHAGLVSTGNMALKSRTFGQAPCLGVQIQGEWR